MHFPAVMERVRRVRARLTERVSVERLVAMGINVYFGEARFAGPDSVRIGRKILRFKNALIATGARPVRPPIPGIEEACVFDLRERVRPDRVPETDAWSSAGAQSAASSRRPLLDWDRRSRWFRTSRTFLATKSETQRSCCPMPWGETGSRFI